MMFKLQTPYIQCKILMGENFDVFDAFKRLSNLTCQMFKPLQLLQAHG